MLPLLKFAGGLMLLGIILLGAAQYALTRNRKTPPTFFGTGGAFLSVCSLLTWTWGSAQTTSTLFSQTLNAGVVPLPLSSLFGAFAALQFVGITLSPSCFDSIPFQSLWACTGVVCFSFIGGIISLTIQRLLPTAKLLQRGAQLLLGLSALLVVTG